MPDGERLFVGGGVMSWEAKKYRGYARECFRLAEQAHSAVKRNKLLELAQVWMDAALREEQVAVDARKLSAKAAQGGGTADRHAA
jgi:hypothetical protein